MNELFAPPESGLLISYLRVSLEDENTGESESISNQRDLIGCYLKQHPEFTAYKVMEVVDDGHSGTNFDRPGIKRVLELVRQRKVAAILVKDLSRFGRNYKEVGSYLEQVFPFLGVRFISVNDGYDSNEYIGSTGGLDIACKALVHDLYSRDISRKVKSSRYARLRRGDYFCSVAPYGYVKSSEDKHRLVIDPPAAKVVRRIFDMTLAGFCTTEIARTLNLEDVPSPLIYMRQKYPGKKIAALEDGFWNNFVVLSILYEERYTGKAISGMRPNLRVGSKQRRKTKREDWIIVPDCFEAIVSENEFQEARRCIDHLEKRKMTAPPHLFYKKLHCAGCGRAMRRSNTTVRYFYCNTRKFRDSPNCMEGRLMEQDLIDAVLLAIRQQARIVVDTGQLIQQAKKNRGTRVSILEQQIRALEKRIKASNRSRIELFEHLNDGVISTEQYKTRRDHLSRQIQELEAQNRQLTEQMRELLGNATENGFVWLFRPCEQVESLTQEIVDALIRSIRIYRADQIEIQWKYLDDYKKCLDLLKDQTDRKAV